MGVEGKTGPSKLPIGFTFNMKHRQSQDTEDLLKSFYLNSIFWSSTWRKDIRMITNGVSLFLTLDLPENSAREVTSDDRDYQLALRYRKNLLDYFSQLDALAKKARALPSKTASSTRLHINIHLATAQYLQANMFTLQLMPKVFKDMPMQFKTLNDVVGHGADLSKMRILTAAEREELNKLKKDLAVLLEQLSQLESFIADATKKRRFEDATSLKESLEELTMEVEVIKNKIRDLESADRGNSK